MGRPPSTLCGLTSARWAAALGDESPAALLRARRTLAGTRDPGPLELARVADSTGVDLGELVRALAALRGYLRPATATVEDGEP